MNRMEQVELFAAEDAQVGALDDDDIRHADDDDSDIESEGDLCERCEHPRTNHEDGTGACTCGKCRRFKD